MFIAYANYSYTRATGLDVTSAQDQSKGKQLIYVPLHVANMSLYFSYHRFFLKAVNTYTDAVFTTSDNSEALQAYYLLDVETGKDFTIRNIDLGFSFRVNNITDRQYQTVAQRPMAGRSFEGILKFNISKL
jgi:vitamin B12 transporter